MAEPPNPDSVDPPPETLDELYDHAPCGYLTTRADGVIVRVNATLLGMLGEPSTMLLGRKLHAILAPEDAAFFKTYYSAAQRRSDVLNAVRTSLVCANGDQLPCLLTCRPVTDADGHVLGYRIIVLSAAERMAYEHELLQEQEHTRLQVAKLRDLSADLERQVEARTADQVQAQKMESLGHLTGGIAHDFNNLLTPILISLDLLHRRYLTDERALRMTASALSAAERGRMLIARLLAFARRQHLRPTAVDLGRLVCGMSGLIAQTAGPLITLRVNMAAALPPARADPKQLETALLNLCINARDAMPNGGGLAITGAEVTIRFERGSELPPGRYVLLSVSDTGSGMNAETLQRATEPFYSTKSIGKGTGLGLSMVYGLAAQSGGRLVLESTPGQGTTATVWLPVDPSAALPVKRIERIADVHHKPSLTILLVDDDELVRFATGEMLVDLGHSIVQASSGSMAQQALTQHAPFDLLITDYLMPGMTGVELAHKARLLQPNLPVLLITGYANIKDVDSGGLQRLAKPYGTNELSKAITEALNGDLVSAS